MFAVSASRKNGFLIAVVRILGLAVSIVLVVFGLYPLIHNLAHGRIKGALNCSG